MTRKNRQTRILELISSKEIGTQSELVDALSAEGFEVTQATASRDIKELGLVKVLTDGKTYKYAVPEISDKSSRHINLFKESVISIEKAMNIIVIRTITGAANSACLLIDKLSLSSILGTLAGDDTIMVVVRSLEETNSVYAKLKEFLAK